MSSISQNLQPFTGNGDVSIWVKNSRVGWYCSGGGGIISLQNVSLIMSYPHYKSTAANFLTIVATHGYWAARFVMLSIPSVTRIIFFLALCSGSVTICFNLVRRCWDSNTQRSACEANAQTDCGTADTKTPLLAKCPIGLSLILTFAKNALKKNMLGKIPVIIYVTLCK